MAKVGRRKEKLHFDRQYFAPRASLRSKPEYSLSARFDEQGYLVCMNVCSISLFLDDRPPTIKICHILADQNWMGRGRLKLLNKGTPCRFVFFLFF